MEYYIYMFLTYILIGIGVYIYKTKTVVFYDFGDMVFLLLDFFRIAIFVILVLLFVPDSIIGIKHATFTIGAVAYIFVLRSCFNAARYLNRDTKKLRIAAALLIRLVAMVQVSSLFILTAPSRLRAGVEPADVITPLIPLLVMMPVMIIGTYKRQFSNPFSYLFKSRFIEISEQIKTDREQNATSNHNVTY